LLNAYAIYLNVTHRRRWRDATVELSCVGGVNTNHYIGWNADVSVP